MRQLGQSLRQRGQSNWQIHFPDEARLKRAGFESISYCPSIFYQHRYQRPPSQYLRERCTGHWKPDWAEAGTTAETMAKTTIRNCSYSLTNFFNWSDSVALVLSEATYDDVLSYQSDMISGVWSCKDDGLTPGTVNPRADEACSYISWLAFKNLRPPFFVPTKLTRIVHPRSRKATVRRIRLGREKASRQSLRMLTLPSEFQVQDWLAGVRRNRGVSKFHACSTIIKTGLRSHELCMLPVAYWPSRQAINDAISAGLGEVTMPLGPTKGSVKRVIAVDVEHASRVRTWIDNDRPSLALAYKARTGLSEPTRLFLSDAPGHEGTPLSQPQLYKCFKLDIKFIWYPHLGRHYFACTSLLKGIQHDAKILGHAPRDMSPNWIRNRGEYWLDMQRRQLGHLSEATTELYLRWIITHHVLVNTFDEWNFFLDGESLETQQAH